MCRSFYGLSISERVNDLRPLKWSISLIVAFSEQVHSNAATL